MSRVTHTFNGHACACGKTHHIALPRRSKAMKPRKATKPVVAPVRPAKVYPTVKATPLVVKVLRHAITLARHEHDNHLRALHLEVAMREVFAVSPGARKERK